MKIGFNINFKAQSLDGKNYFEIFKELIRFTPTYLSKKFKLSPWNQKSHIETIKELGCRDDLEVLDNDGNLFRVNGSGFPLYQKAVIEQSKKLLHLNNEQIEKIIYMSNGFISGYLYDADYSLVQSFSSETIFADRDISQEILGSLSKTPFKLDMFDNRDYDIRFNPGRDVALNNTTLMASCKMWFGKPFFELISKEHLLAFPYAVEVKELQNDIIYIHLFEKEEDSYTPENMFKQWKWHEWINFDKLEEIYAVE